MSAQLAYFAQPFNGRRPGEPLPFLCAQDAEEGGALLAKMADGVVVYQQIIDPEAQIYDEPEVLAVHGDVPSEALAPQGEAEAA